MILQGKQRCLVPVDFNFYKDKIYCDVVTIDMGQIVLGRPSLFNKDVTVDLTFINLYIKVRRLSY